MMNIKKLLCLLLCAAMLASVTAASFAAPGDGEEAGPDFTLSEDAPAAEAPAEAGAFVSEDPEALYDPDEPVFIYSGEDEDGAVLMDNATLTLTVKFPSGVIAPAGSRLYIGIASEAVVSSSGEITKTPSYVYGRTQSVDAGATEVTVSAPIRQTGNYVFDIRPYIAAAGICSQTYYFNGDGTEADSIYVAKGMAVSEGTSVSKTITLPKASHSISGTMTFSSPLEGDRTLNLQLNAGTSGQSSQSAQISVKQGSVSVPFAMGTDADSACIRFSIHKSMYYAIDNTLTGESNMRCFFDLLSGDVSGLTVIGDELLGSQGGTGGPITVTVNITLPEKAKRAGTYCVALEESGDNSGIYDNTNARVLDGEDTITAELYAEAGQEYRIFYFAAGNLGFSGISSMPGTRYAAESGVAAAKDRAKVFSFSGDSTVNIKEGPCWKITGAVTRAAGYQGDTGAGFVSADFADGSKWGTYVSFASGEKEGEYTIYVPKEQEGGFNLKGAYSNSETSLAPNGIKWTEGTDYPALTGDLKDADLTLQTPGYVKGTVKLSGFTAPSCGLAVRLYISDNRNVYRYYVIPAGKSSVNYSLPCFTEGSVYVNGDCYTNDMTVGGHASCNATADAGGSCSGADMTMLKQHPITGTIRLPDGIDSAGVYMQISCSGEDASASTYVSIREGGGTAAKYRIYVQEGEEYRFGLNVRKSTSDYISEGFLYTDSDWKQSKTGGQVTVDGAKSGVDFILSRAVYVSGVFVAQDGGEVIPDPEATYNMLFSAGNDSRWASSRINMGEDGTWSVRTPDGMTGELYMYFNANSGFQTNIVAASYYYSSGPEALTSRQNAEPVTVSETGASDVRIVVNTGYRITGRVLLPEGGVITFNPSYSQASFSIYAIAQGEGENRRGQFTVKDGETSFAYNIIVPRTQGEYTIEYPSSVWSSYYGTTNVAFSADVTDEKTVKVTDRDVEGPDITLQLIKATVTGTVSRPADITGYLSCTVQVVTEKDSYETSVNIKDGEDSADFAITVPDGDSSETYNMYYTARSSGLLRTGYITSSGVSQEQSESAVFSFGSDSLHHSFTLLATPVAAQGRIYFPKDITAKFNVYINAANSSVSVQVDPASCRSSGEYKYTEYSIRNANVGVNYKIYYSVSELSGESSGLYASRSFYVDENGELTADYSKARLFYNEGKTVTQDFYLIKWDDGSENYLIQSEHGVKHEGDSVTYTYTYTYPGECSTLTVHSVAHSDSTVSVKGSQENYDRYLSGGSAITVRGNSITVKYTRSTSYSARYGFAIDSIIPDGVTRTDTGVAALCSQTGSGLDALLEAVNGGKALNAVAVGPEGVVANVAAAAYDAEGRMLAVKLAEAELSPNGAPLQMQFKKVSAAAEVKVFILGADSTPAAEVYIPAAQAS